MKEVSASSVTYVLYSRGRAQVVSQEEWEQSWLDWWQSVRGDLD